jgi:polyribonucleotide nucleotidyltransferase
MIIGPGGKTIKKITADTGAKIDIEQDGTVNIAAVDGEAGESARRIIESMTKTPQPGEIYEGTITRFLQFGAFVEIVPGKDALVHVSQIADPAPSRPDEVLKLGDKLRVRVTEIDGQGRVNATARNLDEPFDPENPEPGRPPRGAGRPGGGDRGGDRGPRFGGGDRDRGGRGGDRGGDRGDRGPRFGGGDGGPRRDRDPEQSASPASVEATAAPAPNEDEGDELPRARFRPRR